VGALLARQRLKTKTREKANASRKRVAKEEDNEKKTPLRVQILTLSQGFRKAFRRNWPLWVSRHRVEPGTFDFGVRRSTQ